MKKGFFFLGWMLIQSLIWAQAPEQFSYQAVMRDSDGKLLQQKPIGLKISILRGSATGEEVYAETHSTSTNINGLLTVQIGTGTTTQSLADIPWDDTLYFLKTETDPLGGTDYTLSGTSQILSVPYALFASRSGGGWPVRQETVVTESQLWIVPEHVTHITVELWGASGGGGGSGAWAYSYSYNLNTGGCGGGGGYSRQELTVEPFEPFDIIIGEAGTPGNNAIKNIYGYWAGDTDGSAGGDSWFGPVQASGGGGGKKGSTAPYTVHGSPGMNNTGTITAYPGEPCSQILDSWSGTPRSYIHSRVTTSKPGSGGSIITAYSINKPPTAGEGGCAIISFFE